MKTEIKKINILLVEDSEDDILLAKLALNEIGLVNKIWTAKNGEMALEKVDELQKSNEKIDLILMDINLPLLNGLEILKELRNSPKTSDYSIAIFTSSDLESDMSLSSKYKADFFIKKPNTINEYISIMKKITNYAVKNRVTG